MLTEEQRRARQQGLGGSDAAAACGLSRFKGKLELYLEKRGEAPPNEEETERLWWGKQLEEPIAERYARDTGLTLAASDTLWSPDVPWMLYHPDRLIEGDARGPGLLEVKNLNEHLRVHAVADLPDDYYLQLMHGLAVSGFAWGGFAILLGGQRFVRFDVERDAETIQALTDLEREFWEGHVLAGVPPDPDGSPGCSALLKRLYPKDSGLTIELIGEAEALTLRELLTVKDELSALEKRETLFTNWLKWRMADATKAIVPEVGEITWKKQRDAIETLVDLDRLRREFPDAFAACVAEQPREGARVFLAKRKAA